MSQDAEWALTQRGTVVLALDDRLPEPPTQYEVTARGVLLLGLADGSTRSYAPVDRKVAGALRRCPEVAVTEPPAGSSARRTTVLQAPAAPSLPGPR